VSVCGGIGVCFGNYQYIVTRYILLVILGPTRCWQAYRFLSKRTQYVLCLLGIYKIERVRIRRQSMAGAAESGEGIYRSTIYISCDAKDVQDAQKDFQALYCQNEPNKYPAFRDLQNLKGANS
jgi:hypothetical protein